jgi:hypothetical protein
METGNFDLNVIGLQNDLPMAVVFLNIDEVAAALGFHLIPPTEAPAVPEQPADPPRYRALHIYLAQPALLLAGAPEIHGGDDAVLQELRRALEAGEIRNRIVVGAAYLPPLAGLISGQIVGELWRSDSVNYASGVFEHPSGVYRGIEICEEDAQAHFCAWSPQKQSPAPQPEAALAEPTESPTPTATPAEAPGSPGPLRAPSATDLDNCIKASAAKSPDAKTSGRQLRDDAPPWFAAHAIRPVTQADMERRLNENNATLRRGTGKRRG